MKKNINNNKNFKSKFILGTAQFGRPYGINNIKKKKISKKEIKKILRVLSNSGISHLDTAESYDFNLKLLSRRIFTIDTKLIINNKNSNKKKIFKIIKKYISNKNTILNTIYIHNPEIIFSNSGKKIYKFLLEFKKKKFFKNIGVSVYDLNLLKKIVKNFKIDVVQLPYNIIDRRFEKYFKKLKENKILIYSRSVFLQGALISKQKNKITNSSEIINFKNFTKNRKLNKIYTCINFVKKNNFIDKIIFGVDNSKQLKRILNFKKKKKILYSKKISSSNLNIIDPRYWKNYLVK